MKAGEEGTLRHVLIAKTKVFTVDAHDVVWVGMEKLEKLSSRIALAATIPKMNVDVVLFVKHIHANVAESAGIIHANAPSPRIQTRV